MGNDNSKDNKEKKPKVTLNEEEVKKLLTDIPLFIETFNERFKSINTSKTGILTAEEVYEGFKDKNKATLLEPIPSKEYIQKSLKSFLQDRKLDQGVYKEFIYLFLLQTYRQKELQALKPENLLNSEKMCLVLVNDLEFAQMAKQRFDARLEAGKTGLDKERVVEILNQYASEHNTEPRTEEQLDQIMTEFAVDGLVLEDGFNRFLFKFLYAKVQQLRDQEKAQK